MIRRKEDIRVRPVQNAQGGEGEVTFYDWLLPEEAPGHGRVFSKLVIPSGASIGYHDHHGEFEAFLVLEGEATVNDNGLALDCEAIERLREVQIHSAEQNHGLRSNTCMLA